MSVRTSKESKLATARISNGLSQREVAEKAGITYPTYQAIEYGYRTTDEKTANKIAKVLGVKVKDVFRMEPARFSSIDKEE